MWCDRVHFLFLAFMCILCYKCLDNAKRYGRRLRTLRNACINRLSLNNDIDGKDILMIVKEKTSGKYTHDTTQTKTQKIELERYISNPQVPLREITFRHIFDAEDMSQMMAFYKDESDKQVCVAGIHV